MNHFKCKFLDSEIAINLSGYHRFDIISSLYYNHGYNLLHEDFMTRQSSFVKLK